jgi:glycosyltransferase involved in cell wall biosynthesis
MTVTLVVPVRDDHDSLRRLLAQAADLPRLSAAVVVDDASDQPHDAGTLDRAFGRPVTLLRQARRAGAGAARNRGLDHVETDHVLFFDGDDRLGPELALLLDALAASAPFDFCLFRHAETNRRDRRQSFADEALWARARVGHLALSDPLPETARTTLAQTSNYPWNKIYRTGFLRENGLRCSETLVHNDIALHWDSFAAAGRILASNRLGAVHGIRHDGRRLTNLTGRSRLAAFAALDPLAERFCAAWSPLTLPFLRWTAALFDWVRGNLDAALRSRFDRRARHFVIDHVESDLFDRISRADPVLALRLCAVAAGDRRDAWP